GTVTSTNPLNVMVPSLPLGKTVTIALSATAAPNCGSLNFTNMADAFATNAMDVSASAPLDVQIANGIDVCDGVDNDCDGLVDEDGAASCDDHDPCTVDTCDGANGCMHDRIPDCTSCTETVDCPDDGDACTTATCVDGRCGTEPVPGCQHCDL